MANLPTINFSITTNLSGISNSGDLIFQYNPFKNLNTESGLEKLNLPLSEASLENATLDLDIDEAYDKSVNLIISDRKNVPKLINSRFCVTGDNKYEIADREGNTDTNIYTKDNFNNETSLIKQISTIINLEFLGIQSGGKMPVGSYNFYFKLSDGDDNMTDFISESGVVVCHIGEVNSPRTIRGGQLNENSEKLIKFKFTNLDLAYKYIRVYYTRTTGNPETTTAHFINDKFKILGETTEITITGFETHLEEDISSINIKYSNFKSATTIETAQNISFLGGPMNNYEVFKKLEKLSLGIVPEVVQGSEIGYVDQNYVDNSGGYEYYNVKNIYYNLGYWPKEYYRFGIVYILNDYSLSPVFNVRGWNEYSSNYSKYSLVDNIIINENNIMNSLEGDTSKSNSKGVITIPDFQLIDNQSIKPLGVKFNFDGIIDLLTKLKEITKGFFIVRQKRIPNVLCQGIGISTSKKGYFPVIKSYSNYIVESFLKLNKGSVKLGDNINTINDESLFLNNALLCPEASLKSNYFSSIFNSSEFLLKELNFKGSTFNKDNSNSNIYYVREYSTNNNEGITDINSKLTLVVPGIDLIGDGVNKFSSKIGDPMFPWKHSDPLNGDIEDITEGTINESVINKSILKIRGEFNTFIGASSNQIKQHKYYNIYKKNFNESNKDEYYKVRYNDSTAFHAITDRISWENLNETNFVAYRGDCFINTYAQRINWNFVDPELPTNTRILDPYSWFMNFRVKTVTVKSDSKSGVSIIDSANNESSSLILNYNKILPIFTYKSKDINEDKLNWFDNGKLNSAVILLPEDKNFKKFSELNGIFGSEKINRPDVNAVTLGHWAVFKICSSINTAFRDIDFSNPSEEAIHNKKRSFYPIESAIKINKLPESNVINQGISNTLSNKFYFDLPDVPFIQTNFRNRIYYSNVLVNSIFQNGNRIFESKNYQDYTFKYGALVKLVEWYGSLVAVMEHGVLLIPVNERAMMANESGQNVYINTENVLPKNPHVLSNMFGSLWPDSIIKTTRYIYGIDTVAKKIWRTDGKSFENISDMQIQKFLNDNIKISELENGRKIGSEIVKTHFNAFKSDVYFTFKYGESQWNLCWNELLNKWVTQYSWFPEFSENINNIFYTFANKIKHPYALNYLYKHGFAGGIEQSGEILPTKWYDEVYPFEFEFVVSDLVSSQKIFDNLKLIANATPPHSFEFEVIGNGFDWVNDKSIIVDNIGKDIEDSNTVTQYDNYLTGHDEKTKLPFIHMLLDKWLVNKWPTPDPPANAILRDLTLYKNNKTKEITVKVYQKGQDLKFPGMTRLKANMQYLEDIWEVQIQPIKFQYVYLLNGVLTMSDFKESKLRDKYLKVRIRYDGKDYAIINAIKTIYTVSYA